MHRSTAHRFRSARVLFLNVTHLYLAKGCGASCVFFLPSGMLGASIIVMTSMEHADNCTTHLQPFSHAIHSVAPHFPRTIPSLDPPNTRSLSRHFEFIDHRISVREKLCLRLTSTLCGSEAPIHTQICRSLDVELRFFSSIEGLK